METGETELKIDSPDYASGASDSLKADADLLRKKVAYERAKGLYEVKGLALKGQLIEIDMEAHKKKSASFD